MRGALFLVNSRAEPLDFSFARIDIHASFLWRPGEVRRQAVAALTRTLFTAANHVPHLLIALADEVPPTVFAEDLAVTVPLCRVAGAAALPYASTEALEELPDARHIFWAGPAPVAGSSARDLLDALLARQGLIEPFDRAELGLGEAYPST